jgi:DNA-binding SARP family transcriptional activator/TolB-like protein
VSGETALNATRPTPDGAESGTPAPPAPPFHLTTLGRIDLRAPDGAEVTALLAQPKRLALLIYLAVQPSGHFSRRDTLLGMFWPELRQDRARVALRQALHFIRRSMGDDAFAARGPEELALRPGACVADAALLRQAAAARRHAEVAERYTGDFLPGFYVESAPGFQEWRDGERDRLRESAAAAVTALLADALRDGRMQEARSWSQRALDLSPGDEGAVRRHMEVLAAAGDRGAALAVFRAFAARLAAEFGDTPSPETGALAARLRSPAPRPAPAPPARTAVGVEPLPATVADVDNTDDVDDAPGEPPGAPDAIPASAPDAVPVPTTALARRPRAPRRRWAAAAAVLAAVALAAWLLGNRNAAAGEERVAVLPFAVSGPASLAYLSSGLPVLLAARMDGADGLRSVSPSAALAGTPQPGTAPVAVRAVARRLGATLVVGGRVRAAGPVLHVSATLYDPRRGDAPVASAEASGPEQELHALADRVATRLLAAYLDDRGSAWAGSAARTTTSPPALKLWLQGEAAVRDGRYESAVGAFTAATEADSTFALAWYRLAMAANWAGRMPLVVPAATRAARLDVRLGAHERTMVRALLAARSGRPREAESLYRAAATERPSDVEAWVELGEVLFHANPRVGRPAEEARPAFEQVLRLDPTHFPALVHLARLAAVRADTATLDRLTRAALANDPDGGHRAELLLLRALGVGDREAAGNAATVAVTPAVLDALWRSAGYTGNPAKAEELARVLLRSTASPDMRASLHLLLAHLAAGQGCAAGARAHVDSLAGHLPATAAATRALFALPPHSFPAPGGLVGRLDAPTPPVPGRYIHTDLLHPDQPEPYAAILAAALTLQADDSAGAARRAAAVRAWDGDGSLAHLPGAAYLAVRLAGTPAGRTAALQEVAALDGALAERDLPPTPLLPRALVHLATADLLHRQGRPAEALARLRGVPEDLGFDPAYAAAVHRRRAALHRALGEPAEAAREQARFTAIWRGCR